MYSIRIMLKSEVPLIPRSWLRPWARSWAGLWTGLRAGCWTFLPGLGSAVILVWGWRAGSRLRSRLLLPIFNRGCWATAGLLVAWLFLGSTARIPLRFYLGAALRTRFWLSVSWTGPGFAGARTRFRFAGPRTWPAITRLWLPFSWLRARLPARSGTRMSSLVAVGTRSARQQNKKCFT